MTVQSQSFSIGEVAMMIGVTTHTIRAWEKRHGVVNGERPSGQIRRYTLDDVELLRRIRAGRVVRGLSVKLAVLWATGMLPEAQGDLDGQRGAASQRPPRDVDGDGGPWRAIVDALPHLAFVVDAHGRVVDVNVSAAKLAGATRERLRGRSFCDFVEPYDRAKAVAAVRPPYPARWRWEVNLKADAGVATYTFDCWPVRWRHQTMLVLLGLRIVGRA